MKEEQASLANLCWPFHEAAIRLMGVKVVLCFGGAAAELVCEQLKARTEVDSYTENNRRRLTSRTFSNPNGIAVIKATHPSRFDWRNPNSDPTVLVKRALQRAA